MPIPRVAIIGRPNVGKSSLLNMIAGGKISIVDPTPGTTRDRVSAIAEIKSPDGKRPDRAIELIDTGGWGVYEAEGERFNEIGVDGYFLEYDSARAGGFEPLRFLPKGKIAVLGLVTTKSPKMETKDELKRRIDEASRYAPLEQLALSPQCGFSSGIGGNAMTVEDEIAKLRLVVETAREVWGTA